MTIRDDQLQLQRGWRVRFIVGLMLLVLVTLCGRLVQLQWLGRESFAEHVDRQRSFIETIPARPGDIVDRHGRLLATTITTRSLFVVPISIEDSKQLATQLAKPLQLDSLWLKDYIDDHRKKHFLWIKRRLTDEEVESIRKLGLPKSVWGFRDEYLRRYPQGKLAAHILGLRDIDGVGRGGLEEKLDLLLRGRDGTRSLSRDARGRVIFVEEKIAEAPQHGRTVVLALDTVVQLFAEQELDAVMTQWKPQSACVIVLDPKTCDVLAMASRPTFDPNNPSNVHPRAWKNTNISAIYEPGSTFKPFLVAWAIDKGIIDRDDQFHCENGVYRMGRRILHDHHRYGVLSVTDILVKSSNIGMAKIGEQLTNRELYNAVVTFGFGRKTGSELPGELAGIVRPLKEWNRYSTGSIPMGQEIAVTPLQLITAHAALANNGRLMNPRLVLRHTDPLIMSSGATPQHEVTSSSFVSQTVGAQTARWIIEGPMTEVVRRGTGKKAQLGDYVVFGKSGTAQKPDPITGAYSSKLHVSSFVCGAPAHDPAVLVLVVVDEPSVGKNHYGGTIAAPAAARILHKTLVQLRVPTETLLRAAERE